MNTQYSMSGEGPPLDTMYMGKESLSRRRSQEQRERRESRTRRQKSQGRVFVRRFDRSYSRNGRSQLQNGRTGGFYSERSRSRESRRDGYDQSRSGSKGQHRKE